MLPLCVCYYFCIFNFSVLFAAFICEIDYIFLNMAAAAILDF